MIDSQSLRAAETVATDSRGYDAAKKVQGRKRHVIVDTLALLLVVIVTAAGVQDRDGAKPALEHLRDWYERISPIWAGSAYAGKLVTWAKKHVRLTLEIVKRSDDVSGFVVLPRRWVVERTLSWICQRRRCVRDYERLSEHHEARDCTGLRQAPPWFVAMWPLRFTRAEVGAGRRPLPPERSQQLRRGGGKDDRQNGGGGEVGTGRCRIGLRSDRLAGEGPWFGGRQGGRPDQGDQEEKGARS
nr:transposase [Streptosporangium album]